MSTKWSRISSIHFRLRFHFGTLKQTILHYLTERRVYGNFVIGKPLVLFLLRNTYFIIGTSLLNPRPKDPREAFRPRNARCPREAFRPRLQAICPFASTTRYTPLLFREAVQ